MSDQEQTAPPSTYTLKAAKGRRERDLVLTWTLHSTQALALDALMLQADSPTLGACAALLLTQPVLARKLELRYDLRRTAALAYDYLLERGWSPVEILAAGGAASLYLTHHHVPLAVEQEEAEDFLSPPKAGGSPG